MNGRKRIEFDLHHLLGDTVSSRVYGIDYLNCFEYTFWQLVRQGGVKNYRLAGNTRCFLTDKKRFYPLDFYKTIYRTVIKNFDTIQKNLEEFFIARRETYKPGGESINRFINRAIRQERFVYILYNDYFNTHTGPTEPAAVTQRNRNEYHCTLLTGYDNREQCYISLVDGRYNVYYNDFEKIFQDYWHRTPFLREWIVYYYPEIVPRETGNDTARVIEDLRKTIDDWTIEMEIFEEFADWICARYDFDRINPPRKEELLK
ncbi:MAG: hypothetical protein GY757_07075, partial [bacterium]|nr:hypothetical protein [bacterium]